MNNRHPEEGGVLLRCCSSTEHRHSRGEAAAAAAAGRARYRRQILRVPTGATAYSLLLILSVSLLVSPSSSVAFAVDTLRARGLGTTMRAAALIVKSVKSRGVGFGGGGGSSARFGHEGRREGRRDAASASASSSASASCSSSSALRVGVGGDDAAGFGFGRCGLQPIGVVNGGDVSDKGGAPGMWSAVRPLAAGRSVPGIPGWGSAGKRIGGCGGGSGNRALFSSLAVDPEEYLLYPEDGPGEETMRRRDIGGAILTGEVFPAAVPLDAEGTVPAVEWAAPVDGAHFAFEEEREVPSSPPPNPDPLPPAFVGAVVVSPSDANRVIRSVSVNDVLIGRGKAITNFPGTVRFKSLASERGVQYVECKRDVKSEIILDVLRELRAVGGQFLRRIDKGEVGKEGSRWVVLDEKETKRKIAVALRTAGKKEGAAVKKTKAETSEKVSAETNLFQVRDAAAPRRTAPSDQEPILVDVAVNGAGAADATFPDLVAESAPSPEQRPPIVPNGVLARPSEPILPPPDDDPLYDGLTSRPVLDSEGRVDGNWEPAAPLRWAEGFGRRSASYAAKLEGLVRLRPGDEGYFDVSDIDADIDGATIVRTVEEARIVMKRLMASKDVPGLVHACDTEVMDIDLNSVGPVGNGYVTCVSMYSGPDFDYGLGKGPGTALWIDNLDDAAGILQEFRDFFESEDIKKVWHNYGFDRHVMWNEGIDCRGLGGDTMHMARLQDTSRSRSSANSGGEGYSLEALTADLIKRRKKPMKEIFGVPRLRKDGTEGNIVDVPAVEVMQRDPRHRRQWIMYSLFDAEGTWLLHQKLKEMLKGTVWVKGGTLYEYYSQYMAGFAVVLTDMERRGIRIDVEGLAGVEVKAREDRAYHKKQFQKWAEKQIGPDGLALNPASPTQLQTFLFGGAENQKTKKKTEAERVFRVPREKVNDEAMKAYMERDRRRRENADPSDEPKEDKFDKMSAAQLKELCRESGLKLSGNKSELKERLREYFLASSEASSSEEGCASSLEVDFEFMSDTDLRDTLAARNLSQSGSREAMLKRLRDDCDFAKQICFALSPRNKDSPKIMADALEAATRKGGHDRLKEILAELREKDEAEPKYIDVTVKSIGMAPGKYTSGGAPSVTADVLRKLAGDPFAEPPMYGTAYDFFGGGDRGHEACVALYSLTAIGSINTMIANFLTSLQHLADEQSRVHCSINLNTETGRLSSRRPNLQNQPALEKDKYKIRRAFQASPGNNFIVADYGQLELRLLASMTKCKSMIEAFEAGGDFHSRTALGMFDYIQKKVDDGECLLEWDYSKGDPPKPMLKDEFASERRKAKTLNFSIAYGKTPHGLSEDWGVTMNEAKGMLDKWYLSRPEVLSWKEKTKNIARYKGYTRTLMGRYRQLPDAVGGDRRRIGHAERASINTPIQGGAADVVMMAMIKINNNKLLKRLGWILLLQIHDEVILEGPEETAQEAFKEVMKCMEEPWVFGLDRTAVPLLVDGSCTHKNWYDAK